MEKLSISAGIIYNRIREYVRTNYCSKEQMRSMFTTICLVGKIEADTNICDEILNELYSYASYGMNNDEYFNYMLAEIV